MIGIVSILFVIFTIDYAYATERINASDKSEFVGKEVSTHTPTVFIKNLPHEINVPEKISRYGNTLFSSEATKFIGIFPNNCSNCLSAELMIQPIRVEYVPAGTKFTIIGDNLRVKKRFPFSDSKIHFLLLLGEDGEVSELFGFRFDNFFEPDKYGGKEHEDIREIERDLQKLEKNNSLSIMYCPKLNISKDQDVAQFIRDFSLENVVQIETNYEYCEQGSKLVFFSQEAYMTSRYYFEEWSLYGRWHSM